MEIIVFTVYVRNVIKQIAYIHIAHMSQKNILNLKRIFNI